MKLIKQCICGSTNYTSTIQHKIKINVCTNCGIVHQDLDITENEYFSFYEQKYHTDFQNDRGTPTYQERYAHDSSIADLRYHEYKHFLKPTDVILDIGSSNNAFVDKMKEQGMEAYGVEISKSSTPKPNTFNQDLLTINFPPGKFDVITIHDVLEHFIEPLQYLREVHKIVKDNGHVVIDFPNFFEEAGFHHWKEVEHLWMFTPDQLNEIFVEYGFKIDKITKPIPSKLVYYLRKIPKKKIKMLFMPGMGDIYWCLTKMESFIEKNNLGVPESYIWDIDQKRIGTKQRSEGFLDRMSFMEYKGTFNSRATQEFHNFYTHKQKPELDPIWFQKNFREFDYVFNMNGILEIGEGIETGYGLEEYESNWSPTMFTPLEENGAEDLYKTMFGDYIFGYFTGTGKYNELFNQKLGPDLYDMLYQIYLQTGMRTVITGTSWDKEASDTLLAEDNHNILIDMVGQTTDTSQLYSLMKGSRGVIGWAAGNTIMATAFNKPTIMFWTRELWDERFAIHAINPDALGEWYFPQYADTFTTKTKHHVIETAKDRFK